MIINIFGCGWLGLPLGRALADRGHTVKGTTTQAGRMDVLRSEGVHPVLMEAHHLLTDFDAFRDFFAADVLIIAIPPRSSERYGELIGLIAGRARASGVRSILFVSTTGVYGMPNADVDELTLPAPVKGSARLVLEAEQRLGGVPGLHTIVVRMGGLVGPKRSPAGFLKGRAPFANGLAPVNLLHLEDAVGICIRLVEELQGSITVNAVCPHHPTRMDFYERVARTFGQAPPVFDAELTSWKRVDSLYLSGPIGYRFRIDDWFDWLDRPMTD